MSASMFQSTPPVRGATTRSGKLANPYVCFNPRPPCGERPSLCSLSRLLLPVSIHAPRAGSDQSGLIHRSKWQVSIHAPRAGSDGWSGNKCGGNAVVSIHAPRAGSDLGSETVHYTLDVSIHAPRAGSDRSMAADSDSGNNCFNPHPPCGERLLRPGYLQSKSRVSIHAPRAGSDYHQTEQ